MKNISVLVLAVLGFSFIMFSVRFVLEKKAEIATKNEIISIPLNSEFKSPTAKFTIKYPEDSSMHVASSSAVGVTYTTNENNQKLTCTVSGVYEPEKQLILPDFELPEYNTQRVIVNNTQWVYSENPNPQWVTVREGITYKFQTLDTENHIVFCERILNTFKSD